MFRYPGMSTCVFCRVPKDRTKAFTGWWLGDGNILCKKTRQVTLSLPEFVDDGPFIFDDGNSCRDGKWLNIQVAFFGGGLFVRSTQSSCAALASVKNQEIIIRKTYYSHLDDVLTFKKPFILFTLSPEVRWQI